VKKPYQKQTSRAEAAFDLIRIIRFFLGLFDFATASLSFQSLWLGSL
jgi:hypothetical protein